MAEDEDWVDRGVLCFSLWCAGESLNRGRSRGLVEVHIRNWLALDVGVTRFYGLRSGW